MAAEAAGGGQQIAANLDMSAGNVAGNGLLDDSIFLGEGATGTIEIDGIDLHPLEVRHEFVFYNEAYLLFGLEKRICSLGSNSLDGCSLVYYTPVGLGRTAICYNNHIFIYIFFLYKTYPTSQLTPIKRRAKMSEAKVSSPSRGTSHSL